MFGLFGLLGLFGFEADLPCDFDLPFVFDAVQAPIVSPCPRCAGSALWLTVIVTNGFFAECVWWQIVTLPVVVVVGVVVVVVPVVLVDVVVVVGWVVDVLVVVDVEIVVEVLVVVLVDVEVLVEVDVLVVELVDPVEVVVVSCCEERTLGPRTPRAAATPIPQSSASARSVAAKRAVRRGRGFTGDPPGGESGVSLSEMPLGAQTCAPPAGITRSGCCPRGGDDQPGETGNEEEIRKVEDESVTGASDQQGVGDGAVVRDRRYEVSEQAPGDASGRAGYETRGNAGERAARR